MSHKIDELPIYDGKSYYDQNATVSLADGPFTHIDCLRRLQMELAYKPYYPERELKIFLQENGLDPVASYDKNLHYVKLLKTVIAVLEALANNLDAYAKIEMNFGSKSEMYSNLRKRIEDLHRRIRDIEDERRMDNKSDFSYMFYTHERNGDE